MGVLDPAVGLFRAIQRQIVGRVLGTSYPHAARAESRLPEKDARRHALDALADFLAAVDFANPGRPGTWRIPRGRVFAEWPGPEVEVQLPAAGFGGFAQATSEPSWLGPPLVLEETLDRYGAGTALAWLGTHKESLTPEVWLRDAPERDAAHAALKLVFRASEGRGSVLLPLPCYFDRRAMFTLRGTTVVDEPEAVATGRRRLLLALDLWVPEVALVDAGTLRVIARTATQPPDQAL